MLTNIYAGILWWPRTKFFSILMELKKSIFSSWLVSWPNGISTSTQERGCLMASFLSVAEAVVPWLKGFLADRELLAPPISSPSYQIIHITQKRDFFFSDHTKIMSKTLEKAQFWTSKVWPFLRRLGSQKLNFFCCSCQFHEYFFKNNLPVCYRGYKHRVYSS